MTGEVRVEPVYTGKPYLLLSLKEPIYVAARLSHGFLLYVLG